MERQSGASFEGVGRGTGMGSRPAGEAGTPGEADRHLFALYGSEGGKARQAAAFLSGRLSEDTVCFLVAAPTAREAILDRLRARRPAVGRDVDAGRLVLSGYATSVDAQLDYWEAGFERALAAGASSVHVVGDVTGARFEEGATFDTVMAYEESYERLLSRRFPVTTLCQHDARGLTGLDVVRLLEPP
jgi:hypothetical protein